MNASTKAKAWIEANIANIRVSAPASIHIDELMEQSVTTALETTDAAIELALQAFQGLLIAPALSLRTLMPVLVISLPPRNKIQLVPVRWPDLAHLTMDAPPSLYVIDRRAMQLPNEAEEYRCPLAPPIDLIDNVKFNSYYRCFRDSRSFEHGWEFESCLYLEAHPPHLEAAPKY